MSFSGVRIEHFNMAQSERSRPEGRKIQLVRQIDAPGARKRRGLEWHTYLQHTHRGRRFAIELTRS